VPVLANYASGKLLEDSGHIRFQELSMSAATTEITINGFAREGRGKSYTRKARKAGRLPAVINSKGKSSVVEIDPKLLSKAWQAGRQFNLSLDGVTKLVKITELQLHPVKRTALHVDLTYAD
jgi:ribosomal protein L25 (general stress protein Ctc)